MQQAFDTEEARELFWFGATEVRCLRGDGEEKVATKWIEANAFFTEEKPLDTENEF